jgi:hypothetical protein
MTKKFDCGSEVAEIRHSVEGVRVLLDLLVNAGVPDHETERLIPKSCSALLNLVSARMKVFGRALNGSKDAAELVEHWNRCIGPEGTEVRAWSPEQRKADAERELRRVAHERRARRRR